MQPGNGRHWVALGILAAQIMIATPALSADTLYDRLGGKDGIKRIVDDGYTIILIDDRIKDDFDNINPEHIKPRLVDLICQLSGGPCIYKGRPMAAAHEALDLTQAKFNALAEDMQTGMDHVGIPYWTQNQLMALLAPMQRDIVRK
jgi:hemoglobin